jgi:ribonucleoside-diphosphate reductase alpha chain
MFVVKRDNTKEPVFYDKITRRIRNLCYDLDPCVDPALLAQKVIRGLFNGVTTIELDELASETAAALISDHPDFGVLAARIFASNLHKTTEPSFSKLARQLYEYIEPKTEQPAPLMAKDVFEFIMENAEVLDNAIHHDRDLNAFEYYGLKVLARSYLLRMHDKICERPNQLMMRVACGLHCGDLEATLESYELFSGMWATMATPTLFSAGLPKAQMSSCFLQCLKDDSIDGIFDTLHDTARILKSAGGQAIAFHNIRGNGSYIRGTNGTSKGIIPWLRNFQSCSLSVDQGGGKRKGSIAIYLEPWHCDIEAFLELRLNTGTEELRCRELFTALWVPDLFMRRVQDDGEWTLFCPNEAPGLSECWGERFEQSYFAYENTPKLVKKRMKARKLWDAILTSLTETGTPYILMKDACNRLSNQQHLGTIRSSNLCAEIVQVSSPTETAVCNLASLALPKFVVGQDIDGKSELFFNFERLFEVTKIMIRNLNKVIDRGWLPTKEAIYSNKRSRAVGLGVQGFHDCLIALRMPFESDKARALNIDIFETMYFAACEASYELALKDGYYETFPGSPMSQGKFQFDLWNVKPSQRYDWDGLRQKIKLHGLRNSLLVAAMPTCSTSQILGNTESFEPMTSLLYVRRALAGEFVVVAKSLVRELINLKLWTPQLKAKLVASKGSIQQLYEIPEEIRILYKTVWEIPQQTIVQYCADRGPFICQSQSMNIYMERPTRAKLSSMLFKSFYLGNKTAIYYLRNRSPSDPIPVTVEVGIEAAVKNMAEHDGKSQKAENVACSLKNKGECMSCSA